MQNSQDAVQRQLNEFEARVKERFDHLREVMLLFQKNQEDAQVHYKQLLANAEDANTLRYNDLATRVGKNEVRIRDLEVRTTAIEADTNADDKNSAQMVMIVLALISTLTTAAVTIYQILAQN